MSLDRALEQLAAGDHGGYESLREAWRACRCAELAAEIERIGRAIGRPAIRKTKGWHAAWIERAREGDPLDLAGLLDELVERCAPRQAAALASALDELKRHADDPQLTMPLLALLVHPDVAPKVHTRIFELLEAVGDPRAIAGLEAALARSEELSKFPSLRDSLARASRTRDRLKKRFPDGVPPSPVPLDALARVPLPARAELAREHQVTSVDALLQAIYDDPTDLGRRAVYGDALQVAGDPRGELIALQLSDSREAKVKAKRLIEKHRRHLLGSLAKAVVATTAEFEAGFLVACQTDIRRQVEARVVFGRPEWATVKRLRFLAGSYGVITSQMRGLEELRGVGFDTVDSLADLELPRLRVLGFATSYVRDNLPVPAALTSTRLPALRTIVIEPHTHIRGIDTIRWLFESPICDQLEEIQIPSMYSLALDLRTWVRYLQDRPTMRVLTVAVDGGSMSVEKQGKQLRVTGSPERIQTLCDALPGFDIA
jgi:uncharacterized protein (TIGR02996 family)